MGASATAKAEPTVDQAAFWNGPVGERWAKEQELFDPGLRELSAPAIDAAAPQPGEAVLDVGCGCGDTTLVLADRVGPSGRVVGLDFSEPMLARAEERAAGRGAISFLHADASRVDLPPASFDLLFSRFGIMFFPEPERAFAHLARALRPAGRVAFVCWQPFAKNPWAKVPLDAIASVVGPQPENPPGAPGPFSLDDPARIRRVLGAAGLVDIEVAGLERAQLLGGVSTAPLDTAVAFATKIGPASRALRDVTDEALRARAIAALREELARHVGSRGVELASACWIVTAKKPG